MLSGDRDETISHIIREFNELLQEYKTRRGKGWGKMIHWEMSKKFKIVHTNKWYMHKPASVIENDRHKLLCDFGIQK